MSIGAFSFIIPVFRRSPAASPVQPSESAETQSKPAGDVLSLADTQAFKRNNTDIPDQPAAHTSHDNSGLLRNLGRTA